MQLLRRKSVAEFEMDLAERGGLKRTLSKWHLTALGIGVTIGAGIFVATGTAIVSPAWSSISSTASGTAGWGKGGPTDGRTDGPEQRQSGS